MDTITKNQTINLLILQKMAQGMSAPDALEKLIQDLLGLSKNTMDRLLEKP